ncbi:MAG: hypothetical protein GY722_06605 [bacterium]|nr:hypothetical protein [bacterium]
MNLAMVLDLLSTTDLGEGNHAVFGSGPLLVRGIIEDVNDIDIIARGEAWERAAAAGELVGLPKHNITVASLHSGRLTVGTYWAIGDVDVDNAIDTADRIEGFPWVRLALVAEYKRLAGRPKDIEHLKLLEQWPA